MPRLLLDVTPLRVSPAFRRLWLGLAVANLGGQLTVVAVGLQVYALSRSTFAVGVLGLCVLVPLVVFGLYGGAIVDRYDRRSVALIASVVSWAAVLGLLAQAVAGNRHVWVLYLLAAVQSGAGGVNAHTWRLPATACASRPSTAARLDHRGDQRDRPPVVAVDDGARPSGRTRQAAAPHRRAHRPRKVDPPAKHVHLEAHRNDWVS